MKYRIHIRILLSASIMLFLFGTRINAQEVPAAKNDKDAVRPELQSEKDNEYIHLGYTTQRRSEISGSVSTITGEELKKSPVSNLGMALEGRLSGLFTQEAYSEPSRAVTSMYVRGLSTNRFNQPLVIVDGLVISYNSAQTFDFISPEEIESVTLLKDAASQALYGIQGANGVIVITTKRGVAGKLKVGVRFDQTFQQRAYNPMQINSAEYATMRSLGAYNDGTEMPYTNDDVQKYRSGEDRNLYPDNDWRDMFLKKTTSMQRVNVDISGGDDKAKFYSNVNVMNQGGLYNTDQTRYNPNSNCLWVNFRSNVDVKLNKYLSSSLNLAGNIKRERMPYTSFMDNIYNSTLILPPNIYGPVTPRVVDPVTGEVTHQGGEVIVTKDIQNTPYALINRVGFGKRTVTNVYAQFALNLDMSFLTKGLDMSGTVSYQTNSDNMQNTFQTYSQWIKTDNQNNFEFEPFGTSINSPLANSKGSAFYYHLTYKGLLKYKRDFGHHRVTGLAYAFYQLLKTEKTSSPESLPYKRINTGLEATYGYDNRYLVKFDIGYSGSEQYSKTNRFTATPAASVAWVVSNESFMSSAKWLSNLKFRAAYGKTANDQSGLGRYSYMDNVTLKDGGEIGSLGYVVSEKQFGNPYLRPEISIKQNYGIDIGLFDNLSVSFDIFCERMENMVVSGASTSPSYQGIPLESFPSVNSGIFENKGYEISADYMKSLNRNLTINFGGFIAHAQNRVIKSGESLKAEDYAYRNWVDGYSAGQQFGYLVDSHNGNGFFNSKEELAKNNLVYETGSPRVGDLKYYDLNSDGLINGKDKAPLGFGALPRYYYGFYAKGYYKNFDLSLLFQGVGEYYSVYSGAGVYEYLYDGVYNSQHKASWTQQRYDQGENIRYPALSNKKTSNHEDSGFFLYDRSFLRLKNVEIGYTFSNKIIKEIGAQSIRVLLSAQNLFTWDNMKTKDMGPDANSYMSIPIYRFINVGVSVKF